MRLEQENDNLAHELVTTKVELHSKLVEVCLQNFYRLFLFIYFFMYIYFSMEVHRNVIPVRLRQHERRAVFVRSIAK